MTAQVEGAGPAEEGSPAGRGAGRPRSARRQFAATILVLEAFVVVFATFAAYALRSAPPGAVWLLGGAVAGAMVLLSGLLRWPAAYVAGSVLQVPFVGLGWAFDLPLMYGVAVVFVVLWVVGLRLGGRIDRERAERAEGAEQAGGPSPRG